MLPGLSRDVVTISRPQGGSDAEGNYSPTMGAPATVMGAWGQPSDTEVSSAATRGQTINASLAVPSGTAIAPGDQVTAGNRRWVVIETRDVRLHLRATLRVIR